MVDAACSNAEDLAAEASKHFGSGTNSVLMLVARCSGGIEDSLA
jgi:hypothetical protein